MIFLSEKMARACFKLTTPPSITAFSAVGGKKENEGPLGNCFDKINDDPYFSTETYEQGESQLQKQAVRFALEKGSLKEKDIDFIFGGDLLNQCVGTTFGIMNYNIPFLGIYGACSTMSEGLLLASLCIDNKIGKRVVAVTSSHYCTAERQYRMPIDYGGQRPPTAQWTATAAGALVVENSDNPPFVRGVCVGKIVDMNVTDANNMGAAMAPAAADTVKRFLEAFSMKPEDFDYIVTGDLGKIGSTLFCDLLEKDNINVRENHTDCGLMLYNFSDTDVNSGASGCGCAASVLCGYFLPELQRGKIKNILFCATGALLSTTVNQQGEPIPSICHAVWISSEKNNLDFKFSK